MCDNSITNLSLRNCTSTHREKLQKDGDVFFCDVAMNGVSNKEYLILNRMGIRPAIINPIFGSNSPDGYYFQKTKCGNYTSADPRLIDPTRNIHMKLDRPPYEGELCQSEIYKDLSYQNYTNLYKNYSELNSGQIQYYVDVEQQQPFYDPVYNIPSRVKGRIYVDPMGVVKPEYTKTPIIPVTTKTYSDLNFLNDSMKHREDMMSLQQRKHNQTRYETRWIGEI